MKRLLALALVLCLIFALGATSASAAVIPQVTLIAAHVNNEESSYHAGLVAFKEKLEELSDGSMTVEIHANGELGGDETELMEKVASGTCDVIVVSPGDLSNAVPQVDILALPFLYSSFDQWKAAVGGDAGRYFAKFVDDGGNFKVLCYFMCGIRSLFCKTPINTLDDMKGITIRVKQSENVYKLWSAYGFNPTAVAYNEIYSAIQNNVIDAAENDIANIMSMKFYEPAPYVTLTEHDFATRFLVCSAMKYNQLTDEQKAWVDEASEYAAAVQWEYDYNYSETCREELEKLGAKFIEFDSSEMAEIATPILTEIAEKLGVTEGYDLIKGAA